MSCASGNVLIVGDFNIDFMDRSAYEYNKFINIHDTFDFIQHINMPTQVHIAAAICWTISLP